jgi:hypothetical protein
MLAGRARRLGNFTRLQLPFASGSAEIEPPVPETLIEVKSDSLLAERCPVTARPDGTAGKKRASEGTGRNQTTVSMRGLRSAG